MNKNRLSLFKKIIFFLFLIKNSASEKFKNKEETNYIELRSRKIKKDIDLITVKNNYKNDVSGSSDFAKKKYKKKVKKDNKSYSLNSNDVLFNFKKKSIEDIINIFLKKYIDYIEVKQFADIDEINDSPKKILELKNNFYLGIFINFLNKLDIKLSKNFFLKKIDDFKKEILLTQVNVHFFLDDIYFRIANISNFNFIKIELNQFDNNKKPYDQENIFEYENIYRINAYRNFLLELKKTSQMLKLEKEEELDKKNIKSSVFSSFFIKSSSNLEDKSNTISSSEETNSILEEDLGKKIFQKQTFHQKSDFSSESSFDLEKEWKENNISKLDQEDSLPSFDKVLPLIGF